MAGLDHRPSSWDTQPIRKSRLDISSERRIDVRDVCHRLLVEVMLLFSADSHVVLAVHPTSALAFVKYFFPVLVGQTPNDSDSSLTRITILGRNNQYSYASYY